MSSTNTSEPHQSSLISVSDRTPPIVNPTDGEVDLEVLRSVPKQFSIKDEKTANWLTGEVFASCGDGTMTVAKEISPDKFEVTQTVKTPSGARTLAVDPATHMVYLPTSEMEPAAAGQRRPTPKPDSFMIVVVGAAK